MAKCEVALYGPADSLGADSVEIFEVNYEVCKGCRYNIYETDPDLWCQYGDSPNILRIKQPKRQIRREGETWWLGKLSEAKCMPKVEVREEPWPEGMTEVSFGCGT